MLRAGYVCVIVLKVCHKEALLKYLKRNGLRSMLFQLILVFDVLLVKCMN
jgi:hypothetical protein